ncbi:MAG TPA: ABC transporter ATP-binding protein [Gaiellaceae bacterium]|nr:ABC transporter ATP-binding protein [Gaiellaceae bacterium]
MTLAVSLTPDVSAERVTPVVELENLIVDYVTRTRTIRAVDGVSIAIGPGEIVGLAGESGCGKSTLGNAVMQVLRSPAQITSGRVLFDGEDVVGRSREQLRKFRWRNVSMVFQSAMNALNPVMRVGDQFVDMMRAHERVSKDEALVRAGELLELVGIDRRRLRAYPHELSGGMRQRVVIGMALALRPELVIMDEPTTALDVVVQREILQQVRELQAELGFAVLFITHDLSLLLELAHRIAIMYAGEIVEEASPARLRKDPRHPYTVGLLGSFPPLHGPVERLTGIPGSPPDLGAPPSGCRFHPRCPHCSADDPVLYARQIRERPQLRVITHDHRVACHRETA